jgi:hypothetical protein
MYINDIITAISLQLKPKLFAYNMKIIIISCPEIDYFQNVTVDGSGSLNRLFKASELNNTV